MTVPEVFMAVAKLAAALGQTPLNKLEGCFELDVDEEWFVAVNGHQEPKSCRAGVTVAPFTLYVQFNGFPAGVVAINGGIIAAGEGANEETLLAALHKRTAEAAA